MKVIFLDIDGVLNSENYMHELIYKNINEYENGIYQFIDDISIDIIVQLCKTYDIKLVITSSWRYNTVKDTIEMFSKPEYIKLHPLIPYIIGVTPRLFEWCEDGSVDYEDRGYEIDFWIEEQKEEIDYVILDDDTDMLESQQDHFIHINRKHGLSGKYKYVVQIKKILKI